MAEMREQAEMRLTGLVVLLAIAFAGAAANEARAKDLFGEVAVEGVPRTYTVFVPDRAAKRRAAPPAVIVLHGGLQDGERVREILGLDKVAQREGFVAVYPDALRGGWRNMRRPRFGGPSDLDFLTRLKKSLVRRGLADPDRVFVAGVSNGGMMVQRLACEVPDAFAGYASIIANMPEPLIESCAPSRPVPMMIINGTDDRIMPHEGGPLVFRGRRGFVVSTYETAEFWRANNRCKGRPGRREMPDRDPSDGSRVTLFYSTECAGGAAVMLLRVEGGGHRVPGSPFDRAPRVADRMFGPQNNDISTAEVITRFFAGLGRTS
jgi:polyhydroxybutyrate depolymerase